MGDYFNAFLLGWQKGTNRAKRESLRRQGNNVPVKLIEPSTGRIVELEVTEPDNSIAQMHMDQLIAYAKGLATRGVQWTVTGKTIQLIFPDSVHAENTRQAWSKKV